MTPPGVWLLVMGIGAAIASLLLTVCGRVPRAGLVQAGCLALGAVALGTLAFVPTQPAHAESITAPT
ncbi:hypothetical protein [Nocardia arthritidis]|uniref:Uncharacterized protein n=1 Tax=Nocardia arthritidis TaxID=228602 RepID=A0A6G9YEQ1_9NOCA|nr:hypothetical protein [Nocardia arthritidis]QIS11557.1 hypothetical protein F5544_18415 [Nocardia arthritidis]